MVNARPGVPSDDVLQGAGHILFVEGSRDGLDVAVLQELLSPKIRVEPLGGSLSIRAVAKALHLLHPKYWFIIDRDDWDDVTVENSWSNFPNVQLENLLIWRRKELESYFLEPKWLYQSAYLKANTTVDHVQSWLAEKAAEVLLLHAANRVLIQSRNSVKRAEGTLFQAADITGKDQDAVEELLANSPLLNSLKNATEDATDVSKVRKKFREEVELLSGSVSPLVWGRGEWQNLMPAKSLFHQLIDRWFIVRDLSGGPQARLEGRRAQNAVAVDLLKNHKSNIPSDFSKLKEMLDKAVES